MEKNFAYSREIRLWRAMMSKVEHDPRRCGKHSTNWVMPSHPYGLSYCRSDWCASLCLALYMGAADLNSGPCDYTASTEPSSSLLVILLYNKSLDFFSCVFLILFVFETLFCSVAHAGLQPLLLFLEYG